MRGHRCKTPFVPKWSLSYLKAIFGIIARVKVNQILGFYNKAIVIIKQQEKVD